MSKYCPSCGIGIVESAKFCSGCGLGINEPQEKKIAAIKDATPDAINEKIRVNLKEYSQHLNLTCLECGYVGLMGIARIEEGKEKKWLIWALVAFILLASVFSGGVGFIPSIVLGLLVGAYIHFDSSKKTETFTVCPSCLLELKVNK